MSGTGMVVIREYISFNEEDPRVFLMKLLNAGLNSLFYHHYSCFYLRSRMEMWDFHLLSGELNQEILLIRSFSV